MGAKQNLVARSDQNSLSSHKGNLSTSSGGLVQDKEVLNKTVSELVSDVILLLPTNVILLVVWLGGGVQGD
eukprot:13368114-Ditylum_brightwellii.AAC.1